MAKRIEKMVKHAASLDALHKLVLKEAEAQSAVTGKPGELKSEKVTDKTETVNKNETKPESLNKEQGPEQTNEKKVTVAEPVAKAAEELGKDILAEIRKKADAQESVTGKPDELKSEKVPDSTEKENKNEVKPEALNKEQGPEQTNEKKVEVAEPVEKAKEAAEVAKMAEKVASYEAGRQFVAAILGGHQKKASNEELLKQAGRRDFDNMIAQAAELINKNESNETEKLAEALGASAFDELAKQAQIEALSTKVAELEGAAAFDTLQKQAAQAELNKQAAAKAELEKEARLAQTVTQNVINALKAEVVENK